jgi:hypothetical protein
MATTLTRENPSLDGFTSRALTEIRHDRKRNMILALGGTVLALLVLGAGVYLAYNDVPAPNTPANATP